VDGIRALADYVIARHYPQLRDDPDRYFALFEAVAERQSSLVARWMQIGFIHGVMNTDNMTISGETIDFGPCAFMDEYDPAAVYSFIDRRGRYAYGNQPNILQWNLARLAETLLPLIDADAGQAIERATTSLQGISARFDRHWLEGFRRKLGLSVQEDGDHALVTDLLAVMHTAAADFTNTFRALADAAMDDAALPESFLAWTRRWRERLSREPGGRASCIATMQRTNPACIPRNHRIEAIIAAAVQDRDFGPFHALHTVLARPFELQPDRDSYRTPPQPHERVQNTFCGT
jgi:uncharacterized protein YdiU (UPF0061 family)